MPLPELLDLALEQMIALTDMEAGAILLVEEGTRRMTFVAERNLPQETKDGAGPIVVGEGIPGITAERCQLLIVDGAKDDERENPAFREQGVMTHVCIPLAVRGRALGVLGMTDRQPRSFSSSDLALFTAAGEQLGVAIERERLFERRARLAERLQALNELMRTAASGLDLGEVFDGIGECVKQIIDFDRISIALHPTDEDYVEMYAVTGRRSSRL